WLYALRAPEGRLDAPAAEVGRLAEQVRTWQRPAAVATAAPFRLCFRLEEPHGPEQPEPGFSVDGDWPVRYLLQAQGDPRRAAPALLAPAAARGGAGGRRAAVLQAPGFPPREFLLAGLGEAASLCPPIEASLKTPTPTEFTADATTAHTFLTETSVALEQAG